MYKKKSLPMTKDFEGDLLEVLKFKVLEKRDEETCKWIDLGWTLEPKCSHLLWIQWWISTNSAKQSLIRINTEKVTSNESLQPLSSVPAVTYNQFNTQSRCKRLVTKFVGCGIEQLHTKVGKILFRFSLI